MDEQSGESKEKDVMGEGIGEYERGNWYQNEVDQEITGVGSRDKVKHNERTDQLLLARLMGQYSFARCRLSASSVIVCNARGRSAAAGPGAWPVRRPTLQGETVRLRSVRATSCF